MYLQHLPVIMSLLRADRRLRVGYVTSDLYAHPVSDDVTAVWQVCVCVRVCMRASAYQPHEAGRLELFCFFLFIFSRRCMRRVVSSASAYAYAT
jgi:hypothetical protein